MTPILENDKFFLNLVKTNELSVSSSGVIFNNNSKKVIGYITAGYQRINMYGRTMAVHRLVYLVFVGEISENMTIDHVDGNKLNNEVSNLECVTYGENNKRAYSLGLSRYDRKRLSEISNGSRNGMAKLTKEQVIEARKLYEYGIPIKDISAIVGLLPKATSQMLRGITYKDC